MQKIIGVKLRTWTKKITRCYFLPTSASTHANLPAALLHKNGAPVFSLNGKMHKLSNKEGYRRF